MKNKTLQMLASLLLAFTSISSANAQNPIAVDDNLSVNFNTPKEGFILFNDASQVADSTLTAIIITPPLHGTVSFNVPSVATYTPNEDYCGTDVFTYQITNSAGLTDVGQVNVTISYGLPQLYDLQILRGQTVHIQGLPTNAAWTNSNASTGFAASGIGSIPDFIAQNAGTTNAISSVSVTLVPGPANCIAQNLTQDFTITVLGDTIQDTNTTANPNNYPMVCSNTIFNAATFTTDTVLEVSSQPLHGTINISGGVVTYFPNQGYLGEDVFSVNNIISYYNDTLGTWNSYPVNYPYGVYVTDCDVILDTNLIIGNDTLFGGMIINNTNNAQDWQLYEDDIMLRQGTVPALQTYNFMEPVSPNHIYRLVAGSEEVVYSTFATAGIHNLNTVSTVVYPNPASEVVNFQLNTNAYDIYELELLDLAGKVVHTQVNSSAFIQTNVSNLSPGLYTYKISSKHTPLNVGKIMVK